MAVCSTSCCSEPCLPTMEGELWSVHHTPLLLAHKLFPYNWKKLRVHNNCWVEWVTILGTISVLQDSQRFTDFKSRGTTVISVFDLPYNPGQKNLTQWCLHQACNFSLSCSIYFWKIFSPDLKMLSNEACNTHLQYRKLSSWSENKIWSAMDASIHAFCCGVD